MGACYGIQGAWDLVEGPSVTIVPKSFPMETPFKEAIIVPRKQSPCRASGTMIAFSVDAEARRGRGSAVRFFLCDDDGSGRQGVHRDRIVGLC